jgi:hypothetical protein
VGDTDVSPLPLDPVGPVGGIVLGGGVSDGEGLSDGDGLSDGEGLSVGEGVSVGVGVGDGERSAGFWQAITSTWSIVIGAP